MLDFIDTNNAMTGTSEDDFDAHMSFNPTSSFAIQGGIESSHDDYNYFMEMQAIIDLWQSHDFNNANDLEALATVEL